VLVRRLLLVLVIGVLISFVRAAGAEPITLTLVGSGTITDCCLPELSVPAANGDPFSFTLIYPAISPPPFPGFPELRDFGSGTLTLSIGAQTLTTPSSVSGRIITNETSPFTSFDQLQLFAFPHSGPQIALGLSGADDSGQWLSTDKWPIDILGALASAPTTDLLLFVHACDPRECGFTPTAKIEPFSLRYGAEAPSSPEPVPEATSLALVGTGLMGLAAMRRWRQRKA
jgi:hypothetical protein